MSNLGECLGYINEPCPNCGRVRVEEWSCGKHICEKCHWCIEDEEYYFEELGSPYDDEEYMRSYSLDGTDVLIRGLSRLLGDVGET